MNKFRANLLKERLFCNYPKLKSSIWIHLASVGEANAAKPLILELEKKLPNKKLFITTLSKTGLNTVKNYKSDNLVALFPFDNRRKIKEIYKKINPKILLIVETELWPNLIKEGKKNNIPVILINARLSENSIKNYKLTNFFWKSIFKSVTCVCAQSEKDCHSYEKLGFKDVNNCRNLKFSIDLKDYDSESIRESLKLNKNDFLIVFGSSRPGEEKLILSAYKKMKLKGLKLILAPRHLTRMEDIKKIFSGENYSLLSNLKENSDIIIIDKMGELDKMYSIADIAVVGGSFYDFGGHNPLEPAFYSKPIIMGEYHSSCKDSVMELRKNDGILVSKNENLLDELNGLYKSKIRRDELGQNSKITLKKNKYSIKLHLEQILKRLS